MTSKIAGTFTISLKGQPRAYTVESSGPEGVAVAPQLFSWSPSLQQADILARLGAESADIEPEAILQLGRALYDAVFIPQIATAFGRAQARISADEGLRLKIRAEPPELAAWPWEAMHDGVDFVAARSATPLVRSLPIAGIRKAVKRLRVRGKLRVLFVGASPQGMPPLGIEREAAELRALLEKENGQRRILFDVLLDATLDDLRGKLLQGCHILCFAGHGNPESILLRDAYGDPYPVSAARLADELQNTDTRLVFLAACSTAGLSGANGPLNSFAQELARATDLPAVVAMQYPINDRRAREFTAQFFRAVAAFRPVDAAFADAKVPLLDGGRASRDLIAPVMYLQADDGALFQPVLNRAAVLLSVALALAIIISGIGLYAANIQRQAQARIALSQQLAAKAQTLLDRQYDVALLLSAEAYQQADTFQARDSLLTALQYGSPHRLRVLNSAAEPVSSLALSPTGQTLIMAGDNGTVQQIDLNNQISARSELPAYENQSMSPILSPDGKYLGAMQCDYSDVDAWHCTVQVWDVAGQTAVGAPLDVGSAVVTAFSPDGQRLASANNLGDIQLWDVNTGELTRPPFSSYNATIKALAFSADGRRLASAGCVSGGEGICEAGVIDLWELADPGATPPSTRLESSVIDGEETQVFKGDIHSLAFSPDNAFLVAGGCGTQDIDSGACWGGQVAVWDLVTQAVTRVFSGANAIEELVFSTDGKLASRDSNDQIGVRQSLRFGEPLTFGLEGAHLRQMIFGPNGQTLALVNGDGQAELWSLASVASLQTAAVFDPVFGLAYSADGKALVAITQSQPQLNYFDSATLAPVDQAGPVSDDALFGLAASPDSLALALIYAANDGNFKARVRVWDQIAGQWLGEPILADRFLGDTTIALGPQGQRLANAIVAVQVWDVLTGQPAQASAGLPADVISLAFSADGKSLAAGSREGQVFFLDVDSGQAADEVFIGTSMPVYALAYSPLEGSSLLAIVTCGGTLDLDICDHVELVVWDTAAREPLGQPFVTDIVGSLLSTAFSPTGETLAMGSDFGGLMIWHLDPAGWQVTACRIASRNLSQAEWQQYLPGETYHKTCVE